jgi:predicted anti-sigma-YlaC factor YlaD
VKRLRAALAEIVFLFTPNCRDMTRLISEARDRKMSLPTRWRMDLHLAACSFCRRYASQLAALHKFLGAPGAVDHLPAEAKLPEATREKIRRAVSDAG